MFLHLKSIVRIRKIPGYVKSLIRMKNCYLLCSLCQSAGPVSAVFLNDHLKQVFCPYLGMLIQELVTLID
jgi:hypothetical protein